MKRIRLLCLYIILCLAVPHPVYASGKKVYEKKGVVFLLDVSGSMKDNDPNRYAIDSMAQLILSLPSNYGVGLVAYNTDICADQVPVSDVNRKQLLDMAESVDYAGYSNTGAGLARAVNMLLDSQLEEKDIIMLSDGEFFMMDDDAGVRSHELYQAAVDQAVREGITIHVIGLGEEMENTENSVFRAASLTEGGIYYTPQALELPSAMESILTERLGIRQMTAAIVDADGAPEHIPVELPFLHAGTIRVLLTSDSKIQNVKTNFEADSAAQVTGERYSLIKIDNPQSSQLEVSFTGTAGSQVQIALIPEYYVVPKVKITYEDREPSDETAIRYDREVILEYTFYDADNENIQLWIEDYFEHGRICIRSREFTEEKALEAGRLTDRRPIVGNLTEKLSFDCSMLPVNVLAITDVNLELEEAPLIPILEQTPEPEPPYVLYGIIAATVMAIIAVLVFRKPQPFPKPETVSIQDDRPAPGKSSYVGKLNIYITRAPSGYDIDPLSYNLFRLPSSKVISIAEVLESCGVKEAFEGAGRVYLNSGQGRSVVLTNQSDCCIMKSGEILMKQKSYPLFEDAKVDITFEDEMSELTFQYKVLKPSEMV